MSDNDQNLTPEEIEALELGREPQETSPGQIETRSAAVVGGVDFNERIITVIAMPYEQETLVPFQRDMWTEVFSRSAFHGLDAGKRRIPVTSCLDIPADNHSGGKLVGHATKFFPERSEGLVADLKIANTTQGTETLELAHSGALSVSAGFMVKSRLDEQLNRPARVRRINRAFLDHIAFVGQPAYPGAKILAMRSDGGSDDQVSGTPFLDEFLNDPIFGALLQRRDS